MHVSVINIAPKSAILASNNWNSIDSLHLLYGVRKRAKCSKPFCRSFVYNAFFHINLFVKRPNKCVCINQSHFSSSKSIFAPQLLACSFSSMRFFAIAK